MAGDHKCPICDATFTRPQHVGRHMRSHTGDRPYVCKECPFSFARSDLLSRHVNKTHRPPDEPLPPKQKRTRRKSMGSTLDGRPLLQPAAGRPGRSNSVTFAPGSQHPSFLPGPSSNMAPPHTGSHTPLYSVQALPSSAYNLAGPSSYTPAAPVSQGYAPGMYAQAVAPSFVNPFASVTSQQTTISTVNPLFASHPMVNIASPEQGSTSSGMTRNPSTGSWQDSPNGYSDTGSKRRACDHCNHSKVRCDTLEPCARCISKNLSCAYTKTHKQRSPNQPLVPPPHRASHPGYSTSSSVLQLNTSLSPDSSFSSPYSTTSPTNLAAYPSTASLLQQQNERRLSAGVQQSVLRPALRQSLPVNPYPHTPSHNDQQPWQVSDHHPQFRASYSGGMTYEPNSMPLSDNHTYPASGQYGDNPYQPMRHPQPAWSQLAGQQYLPMQPQRQMSTSTAVHSEQSSSSPSGLVVTPALTTNSTSPQSEQLRDHSRGSVSLGQTPLVSDMPRRESFNDAGGAKMAYDMPSLEIPAHPMNPAYSTKMFPSATMDLASHMGWNPSVAPPLSANPTSISAPEAPVDQMYQFRTTALARNQDEDDTTESQAGSSAALSSFLDMDDMSYQHNLEFRRRASANGGVWATAFNNMTLHDSAGNPLLQPSGLPLAPSGMFNPPLAQLDAAKRPSLSAMGNSHADPTSRMPSMSDVKDLWKLFMTDPMTGPTPSKEKSSFLDLGYGTGAQPVTTPRPNMGNRTLSKSNSMPDLKSPSLNGQAFFTHARNGGGGGAGHEGTTPIAAFPPNVNDGNGGGRVGGNEEELKEWQEKIKHRQNSFSMAMQHPGPTGRRSASRGSEAIIRPNVVLPSGGSVAEEAIEFPFDHTTTQTSPDTNPQPQLSYADYPLLPNTQTTITSSLAYPEYANRPMASVLQHNQALNQTLGPERAPSFGIHGGQLYEPIGGVTPTAANFPRVISQYQQQLTQFSQHMAAPPLSQFTARQAAVPIYVQGANGQDVNAAAAAASGKYTSAIARPGNKRLASQSLAGADGKKANFLLFDGGDVEDEVDGEAGDGMMRYGAGAGGGVSVLPAEWHKTNA